MRLNGAKRYLMVFLLAAAMAALAGCTRAPQRRGGAAPGTPAPGYGGTTGVTPPGTTSGTTPGTTSSALPGPGGITGRTAPTDLGQQISAVVAGADARTSAGLAAPATPGVSTLVVGNVAYVGIDMATMAAPGTPAGAPAPGPAVGGTPTGRTMGGTAAGRRAMGGGTAGGGTAGGAPGPTGTATGVPGTTAGTTGTTTGTPGAPGAATGVPGSLAGLSGAQLQDSVRTRVRAAFPQIADVFVTTDVDLVTRLSRVTGDMLAGASAAAHLDEIIAITRAMTPATGGRR